MVGSRLTIGLAQYELVGNKVKGEKAGEKMPMEQTESLGTRIMEPMIDV
jgi:hypothetical protein